jgi:hypothetical protein
MEKSHDFVAPFKKKERFQLNLFFVNSMQFHPNPNHVEFLEMSMKVFSRKSIKYWQ